MFVIQISLNDLNDTHLHVLTLENLEPKIFTHCDSRSAQSRIYRGVWNYCCIPIEKDFNKKNRKITNECRVLNMCCLCCSKISEWSTRTHFNDHIHHVEITHTRIHTNELVWDNRHFLSSGPIFITHCKTQKKNNKINFNSFS